MLENILQNRIIVAGTGLGRRLTALVLSLVMLVCLFPSVTAVAAGGTSVEDLYLLRVDTGTASGKNVMFLGVRFTDETGRERTEYIFPHEGDLAASYALAASYGSPNERLDTVKTATKYSTVGYRDRDGLCADSTDYYLFSPHYPVQKILGVDIFMRYPTDGSVSNGWTCRGIYLYEVNEMFGLGMAGYYSNDYFVRFRGKLLGSLKSDTDVVDFTLNKSDMLYRAGREEYSGYEFVEPAMGEASYSNVGDEGEYLLRIDLADVYDGGIEALASELKDNKRLMYPVETLTAVITYLDCYGKPRCVSLPVVTSTLGWAVESGMLEPSLPISGVAQQGESLIFPCDLPDFDSLYGFRLVYGLQAADVAGVVADLGMRGTERLQAAQKESFFLSGVSLYGRDAIEKVHRGSSPASLALYVEEDCKPLYYYTAPMVTGDQITAGGTDISVRAYQSGASLKPVSTAETFVVKITTDDMAAAATTEDLELAVTYLATDGSVKTSQPISLREAAREFYGYWPGANGDVSYLAGVSAGRTLVVPIRIEDVQQFRSATFSMDSRAQDDWQMSEIMIFYPKSIEKRRIVWEDIGISNRTITREFDDTDSARVAWYPNPGDVTAAGESGPEKLYLNGKNNRKTVYFSGAGGGRGNGGTTKEESSYVNWSDIQYSMSYREALQDLGFTRTAATYTVNVEVASNDGIGASDDCGSSNLFYFKLIFENGCSGFVLANQQLTSDGFRAGRTETFYISTNEDYGALSAVAIIPETESDSDNRDIFDKLNIRKITVTKVDGKTSREAGDSADVGGLSQFWTVDDVGWIGIEYFDKGAESTVSGREGRTEGELSRVYGVTQSGYAINLLFSVTTGSYDKHITDVDYVPGAKYPQYEGTLTATIEYYDSDYILRTADVDVARAMYEYAEMTPKYLTDKEGTQLSNACVDPGFMLRAGHTDRFIVNLPDVKQVVKIRFDACGLVSTTWNVDSVTVDQITSDGVLQLTTRGEYQRTNQVEALCQSTSTIGYKLKTVAPDRKDDILGEEQELPVRFSNGTIEIESQDGIWSTSIRREPTNRNDSINLYVYMDGDSSSATSIWDYEMNAAIQYSQGSAPYQLAVSGMQKDIQRNMFYATGLRADGLTGIDVLTLCADSYERVNAPAERVVVQHVRSGVIISTHVIDCNGLSLSLRQELYPGEYNSASMQGNQLVQLCFSPEMTESVELSPEKRDVAVAIRYKTVNDLGNTYYTSRYVYLTDIKDMVGDTEVSRYGTITPGMIVELPFDESCVSEIVGVVVASVGKVDATVDSACVGVYATSGDQKGELIDWYNFAEPKTLSATPQAMSATEETVVPILMRFTTNENAKILSSGSDSSNAAPIRMALTYINSETGACETASFADIRDYLVDGSFTADESGAGTATIRFFMKNVDSIRYITLEPYTVNPYGSAAWGLGSCYCEAVIDKVKKSSSVKLDQLVAQDQPVTVNFSTVLVELEGSCYEPEFDVTNRCKTGSDGTAELTVSPGQTVVITPKISGSVDGMGYTVEAQQIIGSARSNVYCYLDNSSFIRFTPPQDGSTTEVRRYIVTVRSEEMPDVKASIEINVLPNEEQPEEIVIPTEPIAPPEPKVPTPPEEPETSDEPEESETPEKSY